MKEIHYLQSQNGNLYSNRYFDLGPKNDPSEFESLRSDVPSEILWCSEALGKVVNICHSDNVTRLQLSSGRSPDAVNLWIGDSASVTSIHSGMSGQLFSRCVLSHLQIHTRTSTLSFGEQSTLRCCLRLRDGVWKVRFSGITLISFTDLACQSTRTHRQDTRAHPCRHN